MSFSYCMPPPNFYLGVHVNNHIQKKHRLTMRFFEGNMAKIAETGVLDGGQIGLFSPPIPNLEDGIPTTDTNYDWYRVNRDADYRDVEDELKGAKKLVEPPEPWQVRYYNTQTGRLIIPLSYERVKKARETIEAGKRIKEEARLAELEEERIANERIEQEARLAEEARIADMIGGPLASFGGPLALNPRGPAEMDLGIVAAAASKIPPAKRSVSPQKAQRRARNRGKKDTKSKELLPKAESSSRTLLLHTDVPFDQFAARASKAASLPTGKPQIEIEQSRDQRTEARRKNREAKKDLVNKTGDSDDDNE